MSVEVFVQAFENGAPQPVPTARVVACFSASVTSAGDSFLELGFGPTDSCTVYLATASETLSDFMVHRPCGDPALAACLFAAMGLGHFILFVPGDPAPIVTARSTVTHIPEDMIRALGQPIVADDLASFSEAFLNPGSIRYPES